MVKNYAALDLFKTHQEFILGEVSLSNIEKSSFIRSNQENH